MTYYIFFNHFHELENNNLELEFYKYKKMYFLLLSIQLLLMFFGNNILITDNSYEIIFRENHIILIYSVILIFLAYINNKLVHKIFATLFLMDFLKQVIFGD